MKTTKEKDNGELNRSYRNGGNLVENGEYRRDCVSQMRLARSRPEVLANALREMGITENGDDLPEDE